MGARSGSSSIIGDSEFETMRAAGITSQGSEFQEFLYAPIGNEQEGMALSVLSALARQDIDPWAEASRLSQLPEKTAATQILRVLDALPHRILAGFDRIEVAGRLSALLPRGGAPDMAAKPRPASMKAAQNPAVAVAFNWRFLFLYFCMMLLMNWLIAEFHAPASVAVASDSATSSVEKPSDAHPKPDNTTAVGSE
jgi:hypothetical protein